VSAGEEAGKQRSHGCDGDKGAAAAISRRELEGSPPSAIPKIVNVTRNGQRHLGQAVVKIFCKIFQIPVASNLWTHV
jgi:hypothetical protein